MVPAYTSKDSHPYQINQMPFSHYYHPVIQPQIKVFPSKSLYDYEQPTWPYAGSYDLTPTHFFFGDNNFPCYYIQKPSYFHAPAQYAKPFSVPYTPTSCNTMELPTYEYDNMLVPSRDNGCYGGADYPRDRHHPQVEYFRADPRVWNEWFPFDVRINQNWDNRTTENKHADSKDKSQCQATSCMPNGVYENSFALRGTNEESKVEKKAKYITKEEVNEPRNSKKTTDDERRKKRKALSDDEAATLIQAAYRGSRERKWEPLNKLKQMAEVSKQVIDVTGRVQAIEASCDLQTDDKQKIIIEETIMKLLLKLDTIQGLPPSCRVIRKSLATELTSLQKRLDSIMAEKSQQQMQEIFIKKPVEDTPLITQSVENGQEQQEEEAATSKEGFSEGINHSTGYEMSEQCEDGLSMEDDIHNLPAAYDGQSESLSALNPTSDKTVNTDVSQVIIADACDSKIGLSGTQRTGVEHETKLEVECQLREKPYLTTKGNGDEVVHNGDTSLKVNNDVNKIQPAAVEFGISMKEEEMEKSEVLASKELPVTEHDGGLDDNKKLVEENNKLIEMMQKLMEAGSEQFIIISNLTARVKDLEKKLANIRRKRIQTRTITRIKCYRQPTFKSSK